MQTLQQAILEEYRRQLAQGRIDERYRTYYERWLRFFVDFCSKYKKDELEEQTMEEFLQKLKDKGIEDWQVSQANKAIKLYKNGKSKAIIEKETVSETTFKLSTKAQESNKQINFETYKKEKQDSFISDSKEPYLRSEPPDFLKNPWKEAYSKLDTAIQVKHYSFETFKAYKSWLGKFQEFTFCQDPNLLSSKNVQDFLSYLAVEKKISASSQNQAFHALLFVFRYVLQKDLGEMTKVVRAKRTLYIPTVLSKEEVEKIFRYLSPPFSLMVKLLYGCGLRLSECTSLRVQNFNFDDGLLTIHSGKGQKSRIVPLPQKLSSELQEQLQKVIEVHRKDVLDEYDGTFLPKSSGKKYAKAALELAWQWFFPAENLTQIRDTQERKRYHVHETSLQRAVKQAARQAKILKRVSPHTFRHSYASHLLQANFDIRTIQQLLGHSDVRTTMLYTHTAQIQTRKEAQSPFDLL